MTAKNILVVEDDKPSQTILSRLLANQGYEIRTANNGKESIDAIGKEEPSLVLLDILMPGVNGLEVLRWIKQNHAHLPVIMLTSLEENSKTASEAKDLGATSFYSKPPNFQNLLDEIDQILA